MATVEEVRKRKGLPKIQRDEFGRSIDRRGTEDIKEGEGEEAGNQYIRAREKALSLQQSGQQARLGTALSTEVQPVKSAIETGGVIQSLESKGAFEEVTPREVDLTPTGGQAKGSKFVESIPLVGNSITAISQILSKGDLEVEFPTMDGATVREMALDKIKNESFQEGTTASENFGTLIEAIPLVGGLVSQFAGNLVEDPFGNAANVLEEINSERERAATQTEKVRSGLESPDRALEQVRTMEENVAALEGRIKVLINTSAVLRANGDQVNLIQEKILRARERIDQYRQAAVIALALESSGERIIPTDEQIFLELKNSRQ